MNPKIGGLSPVESIQGPASPAEILNTSSGGDTHRSSFGGALPKLQQPISHRMGWASLLGDRDFGKELIASEDWDSRTAVNHGIDGEADFSSMPIPELIHTLADRSV